MSRLLSGFAIWFCGACLLFHVGLVLVTSLGSGRRFHQVVFADQWPFTVPGSSSS